VRIASLNLNKRLRSEGPRGRLLRWLTYHDISLVLTQEPWSAAKPEVPPLDGFLPIGGNHRVFAWHKKGLPPPPHASLTGWWQRLEVGYLAVHNVYLNAYSKRLRAAQLKELALGLLDEEDRPVLVVGDFNLAPGPQDGMFDGVPSTFNSELDRLPFRELLATARLRDLTGTSAVKEFTIVRRHRGRSCSFRCDLVLLSDYLASMVTATYDHAVRIGNQSFSDHSASVIELPVTVSEGHHRGQLAPERETPLREGPVACHSHKTAMARRGPSPFARAVADSLPRQGFGSVLDYGCGRGADVAFYRQAGLLADGYDPYSPFGWHVRPTGVYDMVTLIFVLNVLPDAWQRLRVLRDAERHLSRGGRMLIVARSPRSIETSARRGRWPQHNDGYWSSRSKGTFQRGISTEELVFLADRAGLTPESRDIVPTARDVTQLLVRRAADD
jgi:Methyltransferase domain/Endonuclease/Exonuclease/phosphatase family